MSGVFSTMRGKTDYIYYNNNNSYSFNFIYSSLLIIIYLITILDEKLEIKKQIESLGLDFGFDAFDFEESNNSNSNESPYLKNKISLEEIREIKDIEYNSVDELEQLFLKSYEEECKSDDLLFDNWKNSFEEEEDFYPPDDDGDYFEPCEAELISGSEEPILCQQGI